MKILTIEDKKIASYLNEGQIGILPTDTLYGISCAVKHRTSVERIYDISNRDYNKPCIILISNIAQLTDLGIKPDTHIELAKYWPGPYSIVFPCFESQLSYLHRGGNSLAVRLPNFPELTRLISQTGPIISTSANPQGLKPAQNIAESQEYFGDKVDFYVDFGELNNKASTVLRIVDNQLQILRS